jgi:hypothetical protein
MKNECVWHSIFFLKKCHNAVSARNVCALLHYLMEGTYVPSMKNSCIDLVAFFNSDDTAMRYFVTSKAQKVRRAKG